MMKIKNLDQNIEFLGEKLAKPGSQEDPELWDLREVLVQACISPSQGDKPDYKYKLGRLAEKLHGAKKDVNVTIEELKILKDQVGKVFAQAIYYPVANILEGKKNAVSDDTDGEDSRDLAEN